MASITAASNQVYVVTGGNRGLGLGLVKALLARPCTTVVASVRNAESAASLQTESVAMEQGTNSKLHIVELDFASAISPDTIRSALAQAAPSVDHVDVLICNAGMCPPLTPVATTSAADMRTTFEVNTIAPLLLFQALWPLLQKSSARQGPKVIMMTSSIGCITEMEPVPGGAYGPSKAALNWLTRALHFQTEKEGLVALALHPGWVQTRAGQFVADQWDLGAGPSVTVAESVSGMLKVIDGATRESLGGSFVTQTGMVLPW